MDNKIQTPVRKIHDSVQYMSITLRGQHGHISRQRRAGKCVDYHAWALGSKQVMNTSP